MAAAPTTHGPWVAMRPVKPFAWLRLFCFPYGGRGAALFRSWQGSLSPEVDVCAVQLPGRENRSREAPFTSVRDLSVELARELRPQFAPPFALFGHGVGALVAFELARRLREQGGPAPVHLFVSGQRPPHARPVLPPIYRMPDADLLDEVARRYDRMTAILLQIPEMRAMLLDVFRADFTMHDTYECEPGAPLACPITCLGAEEDPECAHDGLRGWREHTGARFAIRMFPGGHLFIESARAEVLAAVAGDLHARLAGLSRGAA